MTRQLISINKQPLLRHLTRSVRRTDGFVQVADWETGISPIISVLPVIRPLPREHPATTRPLPNVYNISGFHSSTEVDESGVERHLGNDRPKPSNLRNLCGAAISAAQFHPSSRA